MAQLDLSLYFILIIMLNYTQLASTALDCGPTWLNLWLQWIQLTSTSLYHGSTRLNLSLLYYGPTQLQVYFAMAQLNFTLLWLNLTGLASTSLLTWLDLPWLYCVFLFKYWPLDIPDRKHASDRNDHHTCMHIWRVENQIRSCIPPLTWEYS